MVIRATIYVHIPGFEPMSSVFLGEHVTHFASDRYSNYLSQGGYVFAWVCLSVCLSVCLFVCEQDNSKTYGWILIKFSGYVRNGKRKK